MLVRPAILPRVGMAVLSKGSCLETARAFLAAAKGINQLLQRGIPFLAEWAEADLLIALAQEQFPAVHDRLFAAVADHLVAEFRGPADRAGRRSDTSCLPENRIEGYGRGYVRDASAQIGTRNVMRWLSFGRVWAWCG